MHKLISPFQSAFILNHSMSDNILLSHDLMRNFPLDKGNPRMCLKLDLSAKDITVSHLFFADDVMIFSKATF